MKTDTMSATNPLRTSAPSAVETPPRAKKDHTHPLIWLGLTAKTHFTAVQVMNWLQDRGLISDNCVDVYDVATVDVERVLVASRKRHFFPPDLAPLCRRPDFKSIL